MAQTDKQAVRILTDLLRQHEIRYVVVSPGSRNAPLLDTFYGPGFTALPVADERSAAYYALGIARQTGQIVALSCTSGTAAVNYAPAVAEAFYQQIPLLVLTADRPAEWIGQREGQAVGQFPLYGKNCKAAFELPTEPAGPVSLRHTARLVNEAILEASTPPRGPVQINIPMREPLYGRTDEPLPVTPAKIKRTATQHLLPAAETRQMQNEWQDAKKVMVLAGHGNWGPALKKELASWTAQTQALLVAEPLSNFGDIAAAYSPDRILFNPEAAVNRHLQPDLLITLGGDYVSKKLRQFLRAFPPAQHWHVEPGNSITDTFQRLTRHIPLSPVEFLQQFHPQKKEIHYKQAWFALQERSDALHDEFMAQAGFAELQAFALLQQALPGGSTLHLANSLPVRYAQWFAPRQDITLLANRGTSGIDGSLSTAAGFAWAGGGANTVLLGDLSFFYDSNALFNTAFPDNLKIVVLHNRGGNIFRFIPGPSQSTAREAHFEAAHNFSAAHIARAFGLDYFVARKQNELLNGLDKSYNKNGPTLLEACISPQANAMQLKSYFNFIKSKL